MRLRGYSCGVMVVGAVTGGGGVKGGNGDGGGAVVVEDRGGGGSVVAVRVEGVWWSVACGVLVVEYNVSVVESGGVVVGVGSGGAVVEGKGEVEVGVCRALLVIGRRGGEGGGYMTLVERNGGIEDERG